MLWCLFRLHDTRSYRWFAVYLSASIARSAILILGANDPQSPVYFSIWIATEPALQVLLIKAVLEHHWTVCKQYPGMGRVGGYVLWFALFVAVLFCAFSLSADVRAGIPWWPRPFMHAIYLLKRCVTFTLAVFLILTRAYFTYYPRPMPSNVIVHSRILVVYLLNTAVVFGLGNTSPVLYVVLNSIGLSVSCACFLGWAILLRRSGELAPSMPIPNQEEVDTAKARLRQLLEAVAKV